MNGKSIIYRIILFLDEQNLPKCACQIVVEVMAILGIDHLRQIRETVNSEHQAKSRFLSPYYEEIVLEKKRSGYRFSP